MEPYLGLLLWTLVKVGSFLGSPQQLVSELWFRMSSIMKVEIQKFDGEISFNLWNVQMRAVLIQHGLWTVSYTHLTLPTKRIV